MGDANTERPPVLTIAGSDPSGGAGIQADLKTFAAHGVFGMAALTTATVGNTRGVTRAFDLPADVVAAQVDAVCADIPPAAVKTGMLASEAIVRAVADALRRNRVRTLVVDPVITTRRGDALLAPQAERALVAELIPLARVLTPNVPEAERLTGLRISTRDDLAACAQALHALGAENVVVKGGHLEAEPRSVDVLFDGAELTWLDAPRVDTVHTHGAGCTFSAAVAAGLARGWTVPDAVAAAKQYVSSAIADAPGLGGGRGPLWHGPAAGAAGAEPPPARHDSPRPFREASGGRG